MHNIIEQSQAFPTIYEVYEVQSYEVFYQNIEKSPQGVGGGNVGELPKVNDMIKWSHSFPTI